MLQKNDVPEILLRLERIPIEEVDQRDCDDLTKAFFAWSAGEESERNENYAKRAQVMLKRVHVYMQSKKKDA